jgi:hypothetical protein
MLACGFVPRPNREPFALGAAVMPIGAPYLTFTVSGYTRDGRVIVLTPEREPFILAPHVLQLVQ